MADKMIICSDCGAEFAFTDEEQSFFREKGYDNDPKRCPDCRAAKKAQRDNNRGGYGRDREMFPAVCAECGKDTMVPFKPNGIKPVYCSDCFRSRR